MNQYISLRNLQYLIALYEHKNFNRAAKSCFIGQSTLSIGIANLEEQLGAQLIERDKKGLIFTAIGQRVVQRAQKLLLDARELMDEANELANPMSTPVRIGFIPTIAPFMLSNFANLCRTQYPNLQLELSENPTHLLLEQLYAGELDALVLAMPVDVKGCKRQHLGRDRFSLAVHDSLLAKKAIKSHQDLSQQQIWLLEDEHCLSKHAIDACKLKDKDKLQRVKASSIHTLVQSVNGYQVATYLPKMAIDSGILEHTQLSLIPCESSAYRDIDLVWRETSSRDETFFKLAELLQGYFSS